MTTHSRLSTHLLVLALLVVFAGPALADDAPNPATSTVPPAIALGDSPGVAPEAVPAGTAAEPAPDSALNQSLGTQYGDCVLLCDGQLYTYSFVTREQCCRGSLTCPSGSTTHGIAFYPYQGFAEICSV